MTVSLALAAIVAITGFATGLVSIDHYAAAYGVSIGTNSAYVSAEIVHGHLAVSAERAS